MGMESKHLHYLKHQLVTASTSNASLSACLNVAQHWKIGDTSSCKKLRTQLVQAQMCMCIYNIYIYIILYIHHLHKVVNKHQSGVSLFFLNRFWLPVSWLVVVSTFQLARCSLRPVDWASQILRHLTDLRLGWFTNQWNKCWRCRTYPLVICNSLL